MKFQKIIQKFSDVSLLDFFFESSENDDRNSAQVMFAFLGWSIVAMSSMHPDQEVAVILLFTGKLENYVFVVHIIS